MARFIGYCFFVVKEGGRIRKNTKPSKVVVVSVLSEYSLSEVMHGISVYCCSQSKHPPSLQLLILSSNIALLLSRCLPSSPQCESCRCTYTTLWILWILYCVLMYVLACVRPMLYLQCPLGSVGDDNLWTLKNPHSSLWCDFPMF